jgi:hypothetical protein
VEAEKLLSCLEKSATEKSSENALNCYSDNQEDFYQIKVVSKEDKKSVVAFLDAKKDEIIDELLDNELQKKYEHLLKEGMFNSEKEKSYSDVKNQVGAEYFSDVLKKIDKEKIALINESSLDAYFSKYLYIYMKNMKEKIVQGNEVKDTPWALVSKTLSLSRATADEKLKKELFVEKPKAWSEVYFASKDNLSFYKFLNKEKDEKASIKEMEKAKELLSNEAKITKAKKIIEELKTKGSIKFPSQRKVDDV